MLYTCRFIKPVESLYVTVEGASIADAVQELHIKEVLARSEYGGLACVFEHLNCPYTAHFVLIEIGIERAQVVSRIFTIGARRGIAQKSIEEIARELDWRGLHEELLQTAWYNPIWVGEEKTYRLGPPPGRRCLTGMQRWRQHGSADGGQRDQ